MKYDKARIEDGKLYGVKFSEYFTVQLGNAKPSICPIINFDHMPVEILIKLAFDSMKVKGRPAMKRLNTEALRKVYDGEISWRVMLSKEGAALQQARADMSDEELEDAIKRLQARRAQASAKHKPEPEPEPDDEPSDDEPSNDINSDNYVPPKP
jgi:hypothetical protein